MLFSNVVLIRHPIFWEIRHFEKSKKMERREQDRKNKGKEKETRILEKCHFKKMDTIDALATPLKICLGAVF